MLQEIREAIDQAYRGKIPSLENPLPNFISHDLVLSIMKEIYLATIKIAYSKTQEYRLKGITIDFRNKETLDLELEIEGLVETEKKEIFKKHCLLHFEDSPSLIVHKATEKFSRESSVFAQKISKLENEYRENVDLIMRAQMSSEKFESILNNHLL